MSYANTLSHPGEIIGVNITKTAVLYQFSPAINEKHRDYAALIVAVECIGQRHGPMYDRVRGPGYVYSVGLKLFPSDSKFRMYLYKASDLVSAYREFVKIIVSISFYESLMYLYGLRVLLIKKYFIFM